MKTTYWVEAFFTHTTRDLAPNPIGWMTITGRPTLEAARAEVNRRNHQEGRGFQHRILDGSGNVIEDSPATKEPQQ